MQGNWTCASSVFFFISINECTCPRWAISITFKSISLMHLICCKAPFACVVWRVFSATRNMCVAACTALPELVHAVLCSCISAEIDCFFPGRPENGQTSYTTTTFASLATYSCNVGYELSGSTSAQCLSNWEWSDVPPRCIRELATCNSLTLVLCSLFLCSISWPLLSSTVTAGKLETFRQAHSFKRNKQGVEELLDKKTDFC